MTTWTHAPLSIADVQATVRHNPENAQGWLLLEYKRHRPRWTLTRWLKRHRPHNPTTRVVWEER